MIGPHLLIRLALIVVVMAMPLHALAQPQAPQSPSPQVAPAAPESTPPTSAPVPQGSPSLIEELGNFWKRSTGILPSPVETFDSLNSTTKSATESLGRLARPTSVANGRVVCQVAPNGAPDCKTAAEKLCQTKGYTTGSSLESDAAESCPARVLMSGRPAQPGECRTDNYVTRALCQ